MQETINTIEKVRHIEWCSQNVSL